MHSVLLDTDIFSDILKGRNGTILAREKACVAQGESYALSVITVMEIIKGLHKAGREDRIQMLLAGFRAAEVLTVDLRSAELAGRICGDLERAGQTVGFADPIIAAIAMRHNLTLVTGNVSHYQRIREMGYSLRLDNWRNPVPLA
jgi:tRNA(fMet)-specific endonuclease VapC